MRRTTLLKLSLAVAGPLLAVSAASAATLYSETTTLTNPNFYVSQGNTATGTNPTVNDAILDNVVVPSYPAPGAGGLNITKVTVNTVQTASAPGGNLSLYYSGITAANDRTNVSDPVINPPTFVATKPMVAGNGVGTTQSQIVYGDGVSTLFTLTDAQLNFTDPGVSNGAEFILGFKNDSTSTAQGINLAKPDPGYENPVEYYEYNTSDNAQQTFTFFAQNDANDGAGMWITVEGNLLPEPTTMGLAALGGLMLLGRRPGKKD